MRAAPVASVALLVQMFLGPGCGPNCQSACFKIYGESECDVATPGQTWEEAYKDCVTECEYAISQTGDLAGFDPDERNTSGESVTLENEQQAAAWMDCVDENACERLEQGYCAH